MKKPLLIIILLSFVIYLLFYVTNTKEEIVEKLHTFNSKNKAEKFLLNHYIRSLTWEEDDSNNALVENPYLLNHAIKKKFDNFIDAVYKEEKNLNFTYGDNSYLNDAIIYNNFYAFEKLFLKMDMYKYVDTIQPMFELAVKHKNSEVLFFLLKQKEIPFLININNFDLLLNNNLYVVVELYKEEFLSKIKKVDETLFLKLVNKTVWLDCLIVTKKIETEYSEMVLKTIIENNMVSLFDNYLEENKKDKKKISVLKILVKKMNHKEFIKKLKKY
jgi:hypothetical protein